MARFTAQVWVSGDHPYDTEINAANVFQAKRNIARREGVQEHEVNRVFEIRDDDSDSDNNGGGSESSWSDIGGGFVLIGGLLAIGLIITLLPYIIAFGAIGLVCWGVYKLVKWIIK